MVMLILVMVWVSSWSWVVDADWSSPVNFVKGAFSSLPLLRSELQGPD